MGNSRSYFPVGGAGFSFHLLQDIIHRSLAQFQMKAFFQHLAYSFIRNALNGVSVRDKRLYAGAVRYSGTNIRRKICFVDMSAGAFFAINPMFGYYKEL